MEFIKFVVVGDSSANKTQLLYNYANAECTNEYCPSFLENFSKSITENKIYKCQFFDTTGQEKYKTLRLTSYNQANAFILCFSLNDPKTLLNVKNIWYPEIRKSSPKAKIILVGTSLNIEEKTVTSDDINEIKRTMKVNNYIECDLYDMKQVNSVFEAAINSVIKQEKKKKTWFSIFHKKKKETETKTEVEDIIKESFENEEIEI